MKTAFFSGLTLDPIEDITRMAPKNAGNSAVTNPVKSQKTDPRAVRRYPIAAVICGIVNPRNVYLAMCLVSTISILLPVQHKSYILKMVLF